MNWGELVAAVAARTGMSVARTREVLGTAVEVGAEALGEGDSVSLRELGRIDSRWRAPSIVRSISNGRKIRVDGRWVPDYRPSSMLCERLEARTPQYWRIPEHQNAWRVAEALVGDLVLYNPEAAPPALTHEDTDEQVHARCAAAFGAGWMRVRQGYDARVPLEVRSACDYLPIVARARWALAPVLTQQSP
jgi:integration host factor subunit beta